MPDATFEREGHSKIPLRSIDGQALALAIDSPLSSGFVSVGRCDARFGGTPVHGMAFVTFDATTKKVASVRLVCE